jgi:3'-phosphoadenosine 5'-phosphosulfate sulfotransferase (PAPS reductase)/FAD synthetase
MNVVHLASISGGKDSLATALLAKERAERKPMDLRFINADLGANESQITHDYIGYLEKALGAPIQRMRANFDAEFAARRETIQHHWSQEKRRKEHTAACKERRSEVMLAETPFTPGEKWAAWRKACDAECRIRVSPPVPQEIIDRAKALLVPTGEPFLDLCMLKGRFPSRTAQFCTERLKLEPINSIVHPLLEQGHTVVSWIGERAEESPKRAAKPPMQRIRWTNDVGDLVLYRPIHKWTAADTFAIAKRHGVKSNPLYLMGFRRVGCMLCINCGKDEIAQADQRFPEVIKRIREWERIVALVSRRGDATFFPAPMIPGDESDTTRAAIDKAVEWARTSRGGRQFDLLQRLARDKADEEGAMCESAYGLCE